MLVKLTPLHFPLNALFWWTDRAEFDIHVTLLSSVKSRDLDVTTHQVAADKDEGLRVVRSHRIAFMPVDVAQAVIEIILDNVTIPIAKVVCRTYVLILHSASQAFN